MIRFIAFLSLLALPGLLSAEECCDCQCNHCGCQAHCQKYCHVVCEMKDVKVTCYCCKEVDICLPGHSKKCGEVCEPNPCCQAHPAECDCNCGHHEPCFLDALFGHDGCCPHRNVWEAHCSNEIRTANKLIKYEVTKKVPTFKWVVEYCCDDCRCKMAADDAKMGDKTPAPQTVAVIEQPAGPLADGPPVNVPSMDRMPAAAQQVNYQAPEIAAPNHSAPWDKLFK